MCYYFIGKVVATTKLVVVVGINGIVVMAWEVEDDFGSKVVVAVELVIAVGVNVIVVAARRWRMTLAA